MHTHISRIIIKESNSQSDSMKGNQVGWKKDSSFLFKKKEKSEYTQKIRNASQNVTFSSQSLAVFYSFSLCKVISVKKAKLAKSSDNAHRRREKNTLVIKNLQSNPSEIIQATTGAYASAR